MAPDLLRRRETHFILWRPRNTHPPPQLIIGTFQPGNPPSLAEQKVFDLTPSPDFPELWQKPAAECGLADGHVYHYWFRVRGARPGPGWDQTVACTDPCATTVDWRLLAPKAPAPFGAGDRDPAGVVRYEHGRLVPCDPGGETPDWTGDAPTAALPPNNQLVIYELPTRWSRTGPAAVPEIGVGTFRDVQALLDPGCSGANFDGVEALACGRAYLAELGVNALELLPPADSFVDREWGYATSHYFAADFDLGFPKGHTSPTASKDLVELVKTCHQHGVRFFLDAVMAFATRASWQDVNFLDFHVQPGAGDPEEDARDGFGGDLFKYNFRTAGYDPISGASSDIVPARQFMKAHLAHWMRYYRIDGIRIDSVVNIMNYDFLQEFKDYARALWRERWRRDNASENGAEARFLVVGEELAVPMALLEQRRLDGLWNEHFKHILRQAILGRSHQPGESFADTVRKLIDCRLLGFGDGAQAVNYITSHDVEGFRNERLYNYLDNNGIVFKEKQIKLAFVCLLTAVGIPMIFAGEEFADQHDLATTHPAKQIDPVNFERLEEGWRRGIFTYVARLVKLRARHPALAINDTKFLHFDFTGGRRVAVWQRGIEGTGELVVVVANFSDWGTENPQDPAAEYVVPNWPQAAPGRRWREVTQDRDVPDQWAGREPLYPWEAKVYVLL